MGDVGCGNWDLGFRIRDWAGRERGLSRGEACSGEFQASAQAPGPTLSPGLCPKAPKSSFSFFALHFSL